MYLPKLMYQSMMAKRDATYWRRRLERDRPEIAARLRAGEIPSVRAAAIEAGFIRERTPLDDLRRAWAKASAGQRQAFLSGVAGEVAPPAADQDRRASPLSARVDALQRLAIKAVRQRMTDRRLTPHSIAEQAGLDEPVLAALLRHEDYPAGMSEDERDRIHDRLAAWLGDTG
jgi:hypothetical protein